MANSKVRKCCICGGPIIGWGNNPWPISDKEDEECCDYCNSTVVLAARLSGLSKKENQNEGK